MGICLKSHLGWRQLCRHSVQVKNPLCPVSSVVAAEPHPTEPKMLVGPWRAIITGVVTEEALEHTIRGGAVVVAVFLDIMRYYTETSNIEQLARADQARDGLTSLIRYGSRPTTPEFLGRLTLSDRPYRQLKVYGQLLDQ